MAFATSATTPGATGATRFMGTTILIRMCITARAPAPIIPMSPAVSTHGLPSPHGRTEPRRSHPARRRVVAGVARSVFIVWALRQRSCFGSTRPSNSTKTAWLGGGGRRVEFVDIPGDALAELGMHRAGVDARSGRRLGWELFRTDEALEWREFATEIERPTGKQYGEGTMKRLGGFLAFAITRRSTL